MENLTSRPLDIRDLRGAGGIRPDYDHKTLRSTPVWDGAENLEGRGVGGELGVAGGERVAWRAADKPPE